MSQQYSTQPTDYSQYRQRAGGPRAPPKQFSKYVQKAGRQTGKTFKKAWTPPKYRAIRNSPIIGKYGSGGNVIAPTRVNEMIIPYSKARRDPFSSVKTWSFAKTDYWSSSTGLQRVIIYPVLDYQMMVDMGSDDTTVNNTSENLLVKKCRHGMEIMNTSNNTLSLKAYFLSARTDTASAPDTLYGTALGDAGYTADVTTATYVEPTLLPRFNRTYKVEKVEAAVIGSGSMTQIEHRWGVNKAVSLSQFSSTVNTTAAVTRYIMLVWHGAPARATTTAPVGDGSTIGPSQITILNYGEVHYTTSQNNQRLGYQSKRLVQSSTATIGTIMREDQDAAAAYTTSV